MASPRRRDDDETFDARRLRGGGGPLNGHTRWVVGVVSTALVALAGWGLTNDRAAVEQRLDGLDDRVTATEQLTRTIVSAQSAHEAQSDARWEDIKRSLERIERDMATLKAR